MESPKRFLQLLETDAQDILEYIEEPAPYKDNAYWDDAIDAYYSPQLTRKILEDLATIEKFLKSPKAYITSQQPQSAEMKEAHARLAKVRAEIQATRNKLQELEQKYKGHHAYKRNASGDAATQLAIYPGRPSYVSKLKIMINQAQNDISGITPDSIEKIDALIATLQTHNDKYKEGMKLWEQGLLAEPE